MSEIQTTYQMNEKTVAIIQAKEITYDSIIMKADRTLRVRQTPLQIIKEACYDNWCTYEGRRQAVLYHTKFKQKTPIPINIKKGIYFFPTHSPKHIHNCWIAYKAIAYILQAPTNPKQHSIIHFKSGQTLTVNSSIYILQTQINRTAECMSRVKHLRDKRHEAI